MRQPSLLLLLGVPLMLLACAGSDSGTQDTTPQGDLVSRSDAVDVRSDAADALNTGDLIPDALDVAGDGQPQDMSHDGAGDQTTETSDIAQLDVADVLPDAGDVIGDVVPDAAPDGSDVGDQDLADADQTVEPCVDVVPMMANWPLGSITQSVDGAFRGTFDSPSGTLRFLVLTGTHYQMGYQHGLLTATDLAGFWDKFLGTFSGELSDLASDVGLTEAQVIPMLQSIILTVWNHMVPFMSPEFMDEVEGFADGAAAAGVTLNGWSMALAVKALLVLSNISDLNWSGSFQDALDKLNFGMSPALMDYYSSQDLAAAFRMLRGLAGKTRLPMTFANSCSFFGAWGEHTKGGHYIGSRNLDWGTDTGIQGLAGLVFYFPNGGIPHVAIGYLGFIGSLAGMNAQGIVLSEVGSESEMERLKGEPWGFKFRRILEHADSLQAAMDMALGLEETGPARPTTIGYNFAIGDGDPENAGAGASGAVLETNGLRAAVYHHQPDCSVEARLYDYQENGQLKSVTTNQQNPELVNLESDAVEINAEGIPRLFQVDAEGKFVLQDGAPIEDPAGQPYPVGLVIPCAFYRGDEAMMHSNRMWQRASNGPQGGNSLLVTSGSYKNRYKFSYEAILAILAGTSYSDDVPDNASVPRQLGLDEGEWVAKGAAMGSNVMSIVYDATAMEIRLSFERGSGDTWENAVAHPYVHVNLREIFDLGQGCQ